MTKHRGFVVAGLFASAVLATPASAANYIFTLSTAGFSGSGTFVTSNTVNAGGGYAILSSTGSFGSGASAISLTGPTTFAGADNTLFYPTTPYLSFDGTSFLGSDGTSYNLYYSAGFGAYRIFTSTSTFIAVTSFTLTPAAVPEPASWALMVGGFGLVGGTLRARARAKVAIAA